MNKKFFKVFSLSFVSFLLITILFNKIIPVYEVSSVRPSATLNPVLGLAYGWPAILGCSIANFVSDLISGYGILVAILGVGPQILYGLIPYLIWKKIEKSNRKTQFLKLFAFLIIYGQIIIYIGQNIKSNL